jgi:hypothetical protein
MVDEKITKPKKVTKQSIVDEYDYKKNKPQVTKKALTSG